MENKPILLGTKPKENNLLFGSGVVIEKWWVENGVIKIWKREPNRFNLKQISKYIWILD